MNSLFKKLPEENRKVKVLHVRVSSADAEIIAASAKTRNLNVCDFMRRAALGRRADVRFETEIVLQLKDIIQAIRMLHSSVVERGIPPHEDAWGLVIDAALGAMRRISHLVIHKSAPSSGRRENTFTFKDLTGPL